MSGAVTDVDESAASGGRWVAVDDDGFIGLVGPIYELQDSHTPGRFRFVAEGKHRNRNGFVQGGMLMTFADRAMGVTARKGDPARVHATAQLDMHFVRSARIGSAIEIDVRVIRETRNLVFVEGTLSSEGEVIAKAAGVWSILQRGHGA
jgi:acyl-coenzyme A thioesterase PaaI-like protein